jgi:D-glycero-alpha-D-manno-heptose-7-phosphate kinase
MSAYLHMPLSKYDLAEKAFYVATEILKKPVGKQDEFAAAFGGLNFMTFEQNGSSQVEPLKLDPELTAALQRKLMLFFTGASHHSWSILKEQEVSTRRGQEVAVESLHHIRALAEKMRRTLEEGDLQKFGLLLHEGWEAKKRISNKISTAAIDRLYSIACDHGALGGKITGAGGGGFLLLFCDEDKQPAVREAFAAEGLREMRFAFDFGGSKVVVNDPFIDQDENCASQWTFVSAAEQAFSSPKPVR